MPAKKKASAAAARIEEVKVKGEELLQKIKALIKEGNVRQITIQDKQGRTLVSIPLTIGIVGAVLAPVLAAVGALAALVTECVIRIERR